MESLNNYPKELIDRRINLALDDVDEIRRTLKQARVQEDDVLFAMLTNIEVALDINDNTSDDWTFYNDGARRHLNNKPLNS